MSGVCRWEEFGKSSEYIHPPPQSTLSTTPLKVSAREGHHGFMSATQLFSHKHQDEGSGIPSSGDREIPSTCPSHSPQASDHTPNTALQTSMVAVQPGGTISPRGQSPRGSTDAQMPHHESSPQSIIDDNDGHSMEVSLNITSSPDHDHQEAGHTIAGSGM